MITSSKVELPEPGLYHDVPFETYAAWPAWNSSVIKHRAISMKHVRSCMDGEFGCSDTSDRKFGRAIHCRLLEPDKFKTEFVVAERCQAKLKTGARKGELCNKTPKSRCDGQWLCGTHETEPDYDGEFITAGEAEQIERLVKSVYSHPVVKMIRAHGGCEVSAVAEIHGVMCKARVDKMTTSPHAIIDIKKCQPGKITDRDCEKAITNYQYYLQMALYRAVIRELTGKEPRAYWMFIEDSPPFDVNVIACDGETCDIGDDELETTLGNVRTCLKTGNWIGVGPTIKEGGVSGWKRREYEQMMGATNL